MLNNAVYLVDGASVGQFQTLSYAAFFYFGAFYGWQLLGWVETRGHAVLWLVPILAALRLLDHLSTETFGGQVFGLLERFIAICLALHLAAQLHRLPVIGSKLVGIGKNTLPLYVGHFAFVYVGLHLFGHLLPVWLAVILVTAFALAGSIALNRASLVFDAPWLYVAPDCVLAFFRDLAERHGRASREISPG
jgi:hypothetical protein